LQLFSAASPAAAILTYGLLSALPGVTDNIPLVVLFSGGTVLYTAMHILFGGGASATHSSSSAGSKAPQQHGHAERAHVMFVSLGMLIPLVLNAVFGHEHGS
jgi:hypothetical protein